MKDFKFICKRCEHRIQTRTIYAGELIACPVCEGEIVIPQPPVSAGDPLPVAYPPGEAPPELPAPPPPGPAAPGKPLRPAGGFAPFAGGYQFDVPEPATPEPAPPPKPPEPKPPEPEEPEPQEFEPEEPEPEAFGPERPEVAEAEFVEPETAGPGPWEVGGPPALEEPAGEPHAEVSEFEEVRPFDATLPEPPEAATAPREPEPIRGPEPQPGDEPEPKPGRPEPPASPAMPERGSAAVSGEVGSSPPPKPPVSTSPPHPVPLSPFAPRSETPGAGWRPPAASPFGPARAAGEKRPAAQEREGPHTGVLMLAVNVLIILIVVAVVLIPRNGKSRPSSPNADADAVVPTVPDWPSIPEPDAAPVVPEDAPAKVEQVITSLLTALARNDLPGAARWIVLTADVSEVTNGLAPLAAGLEGGTNVAWRLLAPLSATPEGLSVVLRVGGSAGHRLELGFQNTMLGWRVARLQWSGATNEAPVNLDFGEPAP